MSFEALIDAIMKVPKTSIVVVPTQPKPPREIKESSPNFSISGISPTILNLKRDLERLYKPRRALFSNNGYVSSYTTNHAHGSRLNPNNAY